MQIANKSTQDSNKLGIFIVKAGIANELVITQEQCHGKNMTARPTQVRASACGQGRGRGGEIRQDGQRMLAQTVVTQDEPGGLARFSAVREPHEKVPLIDFYLNLMEFPFYGFNVLLGMDWLTEHKTKIDFELRRVTLHSSKGREVVVVGE
ncbi:hypothetical protein EPI10_006335 [Gossypium australe]|uniref:Uncharacterized protein n=1 Tax=Gossypium australe TaxID=47621 RepID=A0A5B6WQY0_9ROSI|nr:hypothetical protein EPI10_006335 [Gossypium australe]